MAFFSGLYVQSRLRTITTAVILALITLPCTIIGLWWIAQSSAVVDHEGSSTGIDALLGSLERGDPASGLVPVPRPTSIAGKVEVSKPVPAYVTAAVHLVHENDRTETIEAAAFSPSATKSVSNQAVWFAGEIEPIETEPIKADSEQPDTFSRDHPAKSSPIKSSVEVVPYSQSAAPATLAP